MLLLLLALLWAGSLAHDRGYPMTLQGLVTVQEGLCVSVPCSFQYLWPSLYNDPPIHGYWFQEGANVLQDPPVATNNQGRGVQEETRGRFLLFGDPRNHNCSLDIRDARRTNEGRYFFRVERGTTMKHSFIQKKLTLHVTALNHTPDILIPGTLECGHPMNLTCSVPWACERSTPPLFSSTSAAHTSLGPRTRLSSMLTLTPRPQDHRTHLTCQVQFPAVGVTVETTIQLNITCSPQHSAFGACPGDGPGKSGPGAGVVLVIIVEAAAKTLLLLLCLIILMYHRRKVTRPTRGMKDANTVSC
ncbi:myeloid cell surface antigen CD33-like isoform X2 [Sturnira hondurensis]|uniref:myeloid cell surface antigen CD33-like isoform X2 n=1 Tax=Sturnira hondurensis TaxID=192404 RepID=UPI001879E46E|nr:myeloid cell surface antigen CD33-like isoform X2 [Sturnira hondurensis]